MGWLPPTHARYADCQTRAHTSRVNAHLTPTTSSTDTTHHANSPSQPFEPPSKAVAPYIPPHDLLLVSSDAGTKHQTLEDDLVEFTLPPSQDHEHHSYQPQQTPLTTDWLTHMKPDTPHPCRNRRVDVSIDTKTPPPRQGAAAIHDEEGAVAPGIFRLGPSRKKTSTT
jgi:hypothetical protein